MLYGKPEQIRFLTDQSYGSRTNGNGLWRNHFTRYTAGSICAYRYHGINTDGLGRGRLQLAEQERSRKYLSP